MMIEYLHHHNHQHHPLYYGHHHNLIINSIIICIILTIIILSPPFIDPNRVPDWSTERVSLFLRRLGLKQYVQVFYNYGVDGRTLVLLDGEDFENLEVFNKVHIRKIQVEIMRIWRNTGEYDEDEI